MKSKSSHVAVVLVGGSGTRLWPVSRADNPKPFLPLIGGEDLFSLTLERIASIAVLAGFGRLVIVGSSLHRDLIEARLARASPLGVEILLEPVSRNTAPAIAAALAHVMARDPKAVVSVLASDHSIGDQPALGRDLAQARKLAQDGKLVCFGIEPTHPHTGYGYIETLNPGEAVAPVRRFTEKPDIKTATAWVAGKKHFWNSGMFVFRADCMAEEFNTQAPDILAGATAALARADARQNVSVLDGAVFAECRDISFDYAIMEHARNRTVMRAGFSWSDLGSWQQVAAAQPAGRGSANQILIESRNVHVANSRRMVVAIGLEDIVIAETPDVLLIAPMARSQDVAQALALANASDPSLATTTDSPSGVNGLRRRNRCFCAAWLAARTGAIDDEPAQFPKIAEGKSAARKFIKQRYDSENWLPKPGSIPEGISPIGAQYSWAAALARLFPGRKMPEAEISRKLAASAEVSAIDLATGLARTRADKNSGFDLDTQCRRVDALAALIDAGFGEFERALEEAVFALCEYFLSGSGDKSGGPANLAITRNALGAYLAVFDRDLRRGAP